MSESQLPKTGLAFSPVSVRNEEQGHLFPPLLHVVLILNEAKKVTFQVDHREGRISSMVHPQFRTLLQFEDSFVQGGWQVGVVGVGIEVKVKVFRV